MVSLNSFHNIFVNVSFLYRNGPHKTEEKTGSHYEILDGIKSECRSVYNLVYTATCNYTELNLNYALFTASFHDFKTELEIHP